MTDNANTLTPDTTSTNGAAPTSGEPAFLTRARRILSGDIRPEDYLPVTPEVQAVVDRDMAFARDLGWKAAAAGRTRGTGEPDPCVEIRQRNNWLLSFHHGGQNIAYIENDTGIIVLAVGLEEGRAILDNFKYAERKDVGFGAPEPFTY